MTVWRLQTKTDGGGIGRYCIDNNVAAVGWSLLDISQDIRESIADFHQYSDYADDAYGHYDSVRRLLEVKEGDFIWIRVDGRYHMGCVSRNSHWRFNADENAKKIDAANQLTDIWWINYAESDESSVPGAISTAFIKGSTLQRINKPGVEEFCKILFNREKKENVYKVNFEITEESFYAMLSPSDCEDLLCMWLYSKKGYICIPSTNKLSTQLYECVLLNPKNGEHIYVQVKNGQIDINADEYSGLSGEIWFLTTKGKVKNKNKYDNMHLCDPNELYEFAMSDTNQNILPQSIKIWGEFWEENESQNCSEQKKGIIFDTNKSYNERAQEDMLTKNRISAWGRAERFVDRFSKGDYVLYYEKGKGIVAIGEIITKTALREKDEKYHNVSMIVPFAESKAISPKQIKTLLNKSFYFASTVKSPYLSESEVEILIKALREK